MSGGVDAAVGRVVNVDIGERRWVRDDDGQSADPDGGEGLRVLDVQGSQDALYADVAVADAEGGVAVDVQVGSDAVLPTAKDIACGGARGERHAGGVRVLVMNVAGRKAGDVAPAGLAEGNGSHMCAAGESVAGIVDINGSVCRRIGDG